MVLLSTVKLPLVLWLVSSTSFEALEQKEKKALDKMMEIQSDDRGYPRGSDYCGMYYQSLGELESAYMRHMRRLPSDREVAAYFAVKQATDVDSHLPFSK